MLYWILLILKMFLKHGALKLHHQESINLLAFPGPLILKMAKKELTPPCLLKLLILSMNSIFKAGMSEISAKDLEYCQQEPSSVSGFEPNCIMKLSQN